MFENLSDRLERSFKILKGEGKITEINVAETMKDVRRACAHSGKARPADGKVGTRRVGRVDGRRRSSIET